MADLLTSLQAAAELGVDTKTVRRIALVLDVGTKTPAGWIFDRAELKTMRAHMRRTRPGPAYGKRRDG